VSWKKPYNWELGKGWTIESSEKQPSIVLLRHRDRTQPAAIKSQAIKNPKEHIVPWGFSVFWCPETESNRRHGDFQSPALPTELSGQRGALNGFFRGSSSKFSKNI
jgi:hypothetical protein